VIAHVGNCVRAWPRDRCWHIGEQSHKDLAGILQEFAYTHAHSRCVLLFQVGPQVFPALHTPKDLRSFLDEAADHDEGIEAPAPGTAVGADMRRLLEFTEPWTTCPDYQRVIRRGRGLRSTCGRAPFSLPRCTVREHACDLSAGGRVIIPTPWPSAPPTQEGMPATARQKLHSPCKLRTHGTQLPTGSQATIRPYAAQGSRHHRTCM
jgi:hypothetical protein